jgi:hypothetical protein
MSAIMHDVDSERNTDSVPDHKGAYYTDVLAHLHQWLMPTSYFEIGTGTGESLSIANCASVAVDPYFALETKDFIGKKPFCGLYSMTSDAFFRSHDPTRIFDGSVDLAFLDGMHYCEYLLRDFANTEGYCRRNSVIVMHDCVPVDLSIADRVGAPPIAEHRKDWWAGDVWRMLLVLRKHRPDLALTVVDSAPTGLSLATNLDPQSTLLNDNYEAIVDEMMSLSLEQIGFEGFFAAIGLEPTSVIDTREKMAERFSLFA